MHVSPHVSPGLDFFDARPPIGTKRLFLVIERRDHFGEVMSDAERFVGQYFGRVPPEGMRHGLLLFQTLDGAAAAVHEHNPVYVCHHPCLTELEVRARRGRRVPSLATLARQQLSTLDLRWWTEQSSASSKQR